MVYVHVGNLRVCTRQHVTWLDMLNFKSVSFTCGFDFGVTSSFECTVFVFIGERKIVLVGNSVD